MIHIKSSLPTLWIERIIRSIRQKNPESNGIEQQVLWRILSQSKIKKVLAKYSYKGPSLVSWELNFDPSHRYPVIHEPLVAFLSRNDEKNLKENLPYAFTYEKLEATVEDLFAFISEQFVDWKSLDVYGQGRSKEFYLEFDVEKRQIRQK